MDGQSSANVFYSLSTETKAVAIYIAHLRHMAYDWLTKKVRMEVVSVM